MNERIKELAEQVAAAKRDNEMLMRHKIHYVTLVTPSAAIRARGAQGKSQGKSQDDWRPDPDLA